jgi:hypothetical protein
MAVLEIQKDDPKNGSTGLKHPREFSKRLVSV